METHDLFDTYRVIIELPDLTVAISNKPMISSSDHGHDVGGAVVGRVHHDLLLHGGNCHFEEVTSLSVIDVLELPPLDIAVATGCDE